MTDQKIGRYISVKSRKRRLVYVIMIVASNILYRDVDMVGSVRGWIELVQAGDVMNINNILKRCLWFKLS